MSRVLGKLWLKSEDDLYMSGFIEDINGDIPIKIVKNIHKASETSATHVILRKQESYDD